MKKTKVGSVAEVEKQKLEKIKQEIETVKNWSKNCMCSRCASEFIININDITIIYSADSNAYVDDYSSYRSSYGLRCEVCGNEYRFSVIELPESGPGYEYLESVFRKNRVELHNNETYKKRLFHRKKFYYE